MGRHDDGVNNGSAWVVMDVNWLARDVLGTMIKNMQEANPPSGLKLTSKDINNLTGSYEGKSFITAKSYFDDDASILPKLLHSIGACIPANSGNIARRRNFGSLYFPVTLLMRLPVSQFRFSVD
mmetsp:Transcript_5858/g.8146  ORF Transcript_5858/g.8146 Transcript_5858/m.8146 type:complete len:124 (+) Transcript_5858:2690-3061(+)